MYELVLFLALTVPLIIISRKSLLRYKSHGFYRFFAWEGILLLIILNFRYWFREPLKGTQIVSWTLLVFSLYLVTKGIVQMKRLGKSGLTRKEQGLYEFEKTTQLVDSGIFRYIRHPLYSSLLFLAWGVCFKNLTTLTLILAICSTLFLIVTAIRDEKECLDYFGEDYSAYMRKSKRFIPFIF